MAALDAGAFKSRQFVFLVGENAVEYPIHSAIVARQSKPLNTLINGPMAEATGGKCTLDDVDEHTFERFCQFAYTGNYTTPAHKYIELLNASDNEESKPEKKAEDPPKEEGDEAPQKAEEAEEDIWGFKPKKPKMPSTSRRLRLQLDEMAFETETLQTGLNAACKIRQNTHATEDYTPVLLGHAHLYAFAEKWGISELKNLALSKLHKTLVSFTLFAARRKDIVELIRYAYDNENTPDRVDAVDELRSLVRLYAACEAESLIHCPEFLGLIGEGGEWAQDFLRMIMKRIGS